MRFMKKAEDWCDYQKVNTQNKISLKDVNITCQEEDERPAFVKIDVTEID